MVGVWFIVLASSSTSYGKGPRLILKKTSRLTQAVLVSESIFCAARCCVIFHLQSMEVYLHMSTANVQRNLLCAAFCHEEFSHLAPVLAYDFLSRYKFSTHTSTLLYSSIISLYAQNPVFKIVHDESVKVYLPMYNGNVQQNPLCVESCVTKKFSTSPLFSSTIFDPDANSVILRAHLCTAVDSMRRKPFVRFFIKMQIQYSYQHTFAQQYY